MVGLNAYIQAFNALIGHHGSGEMTGIHRHAFIERPFALRYKQRDMIVDYNHGDE